MLPVYSNVETEQFNKGGVLAEAKECSKVPRVVLVSIDGRELAKTIDVAVDATSNVGQFSDATESRSYVSRSQRRYRQNTRNGQVHGVLKGRLPVVLLGDTLLIRFCKCRAMVQLPRDRNGEPVTSQTVKRNTYGGDSQAELAHGVEGGRASVENLLNELRNSGTSSPVLGKLGDLLLCGDLSGKEKPEEGLRERFFSTNSLGKELLAFRDSFATEADTFLRVKDGAVPNEGGETSHTTGEKDTG